MDDTRSGSLGLTSRSEANIFFFSTNIDYCNFDRKQAVVGFNVLVFEYILGINEVRT